MRYRAIVTSLLLLTVGNALANDSVAVLRLKFPSSGDSHVSAGIRFSLKPGTEVEWGRDAPMFTLRVLRTEIDTIAIQLTLIAQDGAVPCSTTIPFDEDHGVEFSFECDGFDAEGRITPGPDEREF